MGDSKAHATNHIRALSQWIGQGIRSRVREKRKKFDYLYECKSDSFQDQMRSIASNYKEVEIQNMDVDE